MKLQEARRDLYRRLAKEQGYKSRAAFKLIEADEKYEIIRPGDRVLDLGSAPGGWLQVASQLAGDRGLVVGIDLHPVRLNLGNLVDIKGDVDDPKMQARLSKELGGKADVLLSDLSPTVSGVWELDQTRQTDLTLRAVDLAVALLKPDGRAFFKIFEGERAQEVRARLRETFETVRVVKPAASRMASSELYYYCERLRRDATSLAAETTSP